jgi:hypothetical protein
MASCSMAKACRVIQRTCPAHAGDVFIPHLAAKRTSAQAQSMLGVPLAQHEVSTTPLTVARPQTHVLQEITCCAANMASKVSCMRALAVALMLASASFAAGRPFSTAPTLASRALQQAAESSTVS